MSNALRSPLLSADTSQLVKAAVELLSIAIQLPRSMHLSDEDRDVLLSTLMRFSSVSAYSNEHTDAVHSALFLVRCFIEKPPVTPKALQRQRLEQLAALDKVMDEHLKALALVNAAIATQS